jgi:hypothetical protein
MDVYDNYTLYPDKHIGRAEIRLSTLTTMPPTFTSYYEIWEKKLSTGASSIIGRERAAVNNVGALHCKISYHFLTDLFTPESLAMVENKEQIIDATNLISEEQAAAEFKRHLQFQRQRKKTNGHSKSKSGDGIRFRKYEESMDDSLDDSLDYPDESDYDTLSENEELDKETDDEDDVTGSLMQPLALSKKRANTISYRQSKKTDINTNDDDDDDDDDDEFGEMVSAPTTPVLKQSSSSLDVSSAPTRNRSIEDETKDVKPLPEAGTTNKTFLDTVGSWTGNGETSQIIRTIGKLLATFASRDIQKRGTYISLTFHF